MRDRHRRRAGLRHAVDLRLVTRDHLAIRAAQPLSADWKGPVATRLGDLGLLEELERIAAGPDEHELRVDRALLAGQAMLDRDEPAIVGAMDVANLARQLDREAGDLVHPRDHRAGKRAEVHIRAAGHAGRGDRHATIAAVHHERDPICDLGAILAVLEPVKQPRTLQLLGACAQEGDIVAGHERDMRDLAQVRALIGELAASAERVPQLEALRELRGDRHRLAAIDAAIRADGGVVELAEPRVPGARVVPRVGALGRRAIEPLVRDHA